MAKRCFTFVTRRIKQTVALSLTVALFVGLCFASASQAGSGDKQEIKKTYAASPIAAMKFLVSPNADTPVNKMCLIHKPFPPVKKCRAFMNIDESVLQDIFQNYPGCLKEDSYTLDLSNQPPVKISKTLNIFGRTDKPLKIQGLKLIPAKGFPKNTPAVAVYGKPTIITNINITGFNRGMLYVSEMAKDHKIIGGKIKVSEGSKHAIEACYGKPAIKGTITSHYQELINPIKN